MKNFTKVHFRVLALLISGLVFNTFATGVVAQEFLEQNWSKFTRQKFYNTSQGSQIMSYNWFISLEQADNRDGFFADGLRRHGYIPNRKTIRNRDGLPVGFAIDKHLSGWWIGLTCAACHTSQISFNGTTLQIDGGPAQADFYGLISDIGASMEAIARDRNSPKFKRFAKKVLKLKRKRFTQRRADKLYKKIVKFSKDWTRYVSDSTPHTPWGRARTDAFGMIFNRVSTIDLSVPENNAVPSAPVSYPFLWGTSWENKVQWNGIAPNEKAIERLGRNTGEVLGVFGKVDLTRPTGLKQYYPNTVRRINLLKLESWLKELWSPKWPEGILGSINRSKANDGRVLFNDHCASCHIVVPHGEQKTKINVTMTPISDIQTDPAMASNACNRTVDTAQLEGIKMPPIIGDKLPKRAKTAALLANVVTGSILAPSSSRAKRAFRSAVRRRLSNLGFGDVIDTAEKLALDGEQLVQSEVDELNSVLHSMARQSSAPADCGPDDPLMAYKGRPLDGIWATAPYLHNGSIANLYEILLPADQRKPEFFVGNQNFDPNHVGFESKAGPDTFLFDTSQPGNSNSGHIYGNDAFTDDQREQLVEYMKTL